MALTLGAHHVVTGSGQFAIAQPVGLVAAVSGIPNYIARDPGTPTVYKRMAHLNLGHALGWQPNLDLVVVPQLVYPLSPEFTLLRYSLLAGETLTLDEIASSSSATAMMQPYDRAPAAVSLTGDQNVNGAASATFWTYTVPVGRMLFLASAELTDQTIAAPTTQGQSRVMMLRGGVPIMDILRFAAPTGYRERATLSPGGMVLVAGEVLSATYSSTDVGGFKEFTARASGFTFAA